ncbi:MAG: alpha-glucan family phosphorylase [Myxococcota bacterium]
MNQTLSPFAISLSQLAKDFWWTGDPWAEQVWSSLDPVLWEALNHNPVALLQEVDVDLADKEWKKEAQKLLSRYTNYINKEVQSNPRIAYFCMEFGLHESFPIYSGGLGILAGDHIRSACDLCLNFVGVGLFYRNGYFAQLIQGGRQAAGWPDYSQQPLPIDLLRSANGEPLRIAIPFKNQEMLAQAWCLKVGHARLLLLDTNLPENTEEMRNLTASLYGGGSRTRIGQEILLGIGGIRLLKAIGDRPDVYHMNEGHAAFLVVELWLRNLQKGMSPEVGLEDVRNRCVFTTHTPVPAGHDTFYWDLVNEYLGPYRRSHGLHDGTFMNMGRENPSDLSAPLSMTVLALNGARKSNGVSKLHGEVSREMFKDLGVPIGHITNGVHPTAWLAPELGDLLNTHLPEWNNKWLEPEYWAAVKDIPHKELWALRKALRKRLIEGVRARVGRKVLKENALTIGFARRFATYKRGALIFSDPERLLKILQSGVQLIFAGKAHPADIPGQEVLATVNRFARHPDFRDQVVFVPNYDAAIGRLMTQGADVWLNNPRRPREASGTSGQKASLNGNLNFSTIDGWWPEGFDGQNGWIIGDKNDWPDLDAQDKFDLESLYSTLENDIVPTFKKPKKWTAMMAHAIATCAPVFNTHRMVNDYLNQLYIKAE